MNWDCLKKLDWAELSLSFQLEKYEKVTFFLQIWLFRKFTRKINIEDAQLDVTKFDFFKKLRKTPLAERWTYFSFLDKYKLYINIAGFQIKTNYNFILFQNFTFYVKWKCVRKNLVKSQSVTLFKNSFTLFANCSLNLFLTSQSNSKFCVKWNVFKQKSPEIASCDVISVCSSCCSGHGNGMA